MPKTTSAKGTSNSTTSATISAVPAYALQSSESSSLSSSTSGRHGPRAIHARRQARYGTAWFEPSETGRVVQLRPNWSPRREELLKRGGDERDIVRSEGDVNDVAEEVAEVEIAGLARLSGTVAGIGTDGQAGLTPSSTEAWSMLGRHRARDLVRPLATAAVRTTPGDGGEDADRWWNTVYAVNALEQRRSKPRAVTRHARESSLRLEIVDGTTVESGAGRNAKDVEGGCTLLACRKWFKRALARLRTWSGGSEGRPARILAIGVATLVVAVIVALSVTLLVPSIRPGSQS